MLQGSFALAEPVLAMTGRPYLNFFNNTTWLCTNFVLNVVFIHFYSMGIVGAACGAFVSTLCVSALRLGQIYRQYAIWPFDLKQVKPLFAVALASLGGVVLRDAIAEPAVAMPVALGTFVCLYGIGLSFLGIEEEDRKLAARVVRWVGKRLGRGSGSVR
tara:strand:- start:164 stop:640 length:477 start_codon:yes stop_codon:yes gene_type:complete